ncbi:hypothetical protein [Taibaiella soli]|uniref:Uncharacterized protein n=1 Tax=Taibaiella soli TaxID=1649169 RepID=A0A2W2BFN3_9BACT|nr:hypothetical protein [Taibaiella soli]PZF72256.1 hypothetical protein DN068_15120 [Taibaiella soli]
MSVTARIFIWVSLLFFFAGFTTKSDAFAIAKRVHGHYQQLHSAKTSITHQSNAQVNIQSDDFSVQDADDVDSDDHNDDVFISAVLNYAATVFFQQHTQVAYLPAPPERPAFSFTIPRYILFHSLVIPPAV